MRKTFLKMTVLVMAISLAGCATTSNRSHKASVSTPDRNPVMSQAAENDNTPSPPVKMEVASAIETSMDENDKFKMSHALDKPLGKPTHWRNEHTKTGYTVTPVKKLSLSGNRYCRQYTVVSVRNNHINETSGTACVSAMDSNWQIVN